MRTSAAWFLKWFLGPLSPKIVPFVPIQETTQITNLAKMVGFGAWKTPRAETLNWNKMVEIDAGHDSRKTKALNMHEWKLLLFHYRPCAICLKIFTVGTEIVRVSCQSVGLQYWRQKIEGMKMIEGQDQEATAGPITADSVTAKNACC